MVRYAAFSCHVNKPALEVRPAVVLVPEQPSEGWREGGSDVDENDDACVVFCSC